MARNLQSVNDCTTLIKIQVQNTEYQAGSGAATRFETLRAPLGLDDDGKEITTDCFYVNWQNAFGATAIQMQADGVMKPARIRMPYVPKVFETLQSKGCKILRGGKEEDAFMLNSNVDNIEEKNKALEFQVKRWEDK
jgi:hypothetical protein